MTANKNVPLLTTIVEVHACSDLELATAAETASADEELTEKLFNEMSVDYPRVLQPKNPAKFIDRPDEQTL